MLGKPQRILVESRKKSTSVSTQAFQVRYLTRGRKLYRKFLEQKPWIAQMYKNFLELRPGLRIVDVGCGTGDFTRYLAHLCSGTSKIIGVDNRPRSLQVAERELAAERSPSSISYRLGDAFNIPIERDYADLTCCRTLLMHLEDPRSAVVEMTRVTRPRGIVAAVEGGRMTCILYPEDEEYTSLAYEANEAWLSAIRRLERKEFKIGERLPSIFQNAGLTDIRSEIHADAWLNCDTRRRLQDIKDQLQFEFSLSKGNRSRDKKYLKAGGLRRSEINRYYRLYDKRVKELLVDENKLRTDTSFYGATFVLVTGRKKGQPN